MNVEKKTYLYSTRMPMDTTIMEIKMKVQQRGGFNMKYNPTILLIMSPNNFIFH